MTEFQRAATAPRTPMTEFKGAVTAPRTPTTEFQGAVTAPRTPMTEFQGAVAAPRTPMTEFQRAVAAPWTPMTEFQGAVTAPRMPTTEFQGAVTAPWTRTTGCLPVEGRGGSWQVERRRGGFAGSRRTATAPARADAEQDQPSNLGPKVTMSSPRMPIVSSSPSRRSSRPVPHDLQIDSPACRLAVGSLHAAGICGSQD